MITTRYARWTGLGVASAGLALLFAVVPAMGRVNERSAQNRKADRNLDGRKTNEPADWVKTDNRGDFDDYRPYYRDYDYGPYYRNYNFRPYGRIFRFSPYFGDRDFGDHDFDDWASPYAYNFRPYPYYGNRWYDRDRPFRRGFGDDWYGRYYHQYHRNGDRREGRIGRPRPERRERERGERRPADYAPSSSIGEAPHTIATDGAYSLDGELLDTRNVDMFGEQHVLARIRKADGGTSVVDLGPKSQIARLDLQKGAQLHIAGRRGMLAAGRVNANGNNVTIDSRWAGDDPVIDPVEMQGEIETLRTRTENGRPKLVAYLNDGNGQLQRVDLGTRRRLHEQGLDLREGDRISVRGRRGNADGLPMFYANRIRRGDEDGVVRQWYPNDEWRNEARNRADESQRLLDRWGWNDEGLDRPRWNPDNDASTQNHARREENKRLHERWTGDENGGDRTP